MGRRTYGSGSLYRRKDGLWVGRVYSGWTSNGTRRRLQVSDKDKAACARKLRDLKRRISAGEVAASGSGARVTVKAWSEVWLPLHAQRVRPTTYSTDAGTVRRWIVPTIGHRRLTDLTPADLRALRKAITGAGRSTTTALHSHKILLKMLKDATVEGHAVPQRVLLAPKPVKAANDRDAIPLDQLLKVLAVLEGRPDAARWVAAILNGTRQGESLGLEWDRVDLDAGTVDISWQLQQLTAGHNTPDGWEERPVTGNFFLTRPKTRAGKRVIPLVPWLSTALAQARASWPPNPWGLVWVGEDGQPITSAADRAAWYAIQDEAGIAHPSERHWYVHECRHAAATILLRLKVDRAVIEQIMGQAVLVESYVHMGQADALAALEQSATLLGLSPPA